MSVPQTVFTADECQALLDYIERLERNVALTGWRIVATIDNKEEIVVRAKLQEAGKFYVPDVDWVECAGCHQKRARSSMAKDGNGDDFLCRFCFGTKPTTPLPKAPS